jgi:hypothetical protein
MAHKNLPSFSSSSLHLLVLLANLLVLWRGDNSSTGQLINSLIFSKCFLEDFQIKKMK